MEKKTMLFFVYRPSEYLSNAMAQVRLCPTLIHEAPEVSMLRLL